MWLDPCDCQKLDSVAVLTIMYRESAYCVVPPIRIAGCAPRSVARFARQLAVADSCEYPGKAKNSIETLRRAGSIGAADEGGVAGTDSADTPPLMHIATRTEGRHMVMVKFCKINGGRPKSRHVS